MGGCVPSLTWASPAALGWLGSKADLDDLCSLWVSQDLVLPTFPRPAPLPHLLAPSISWGSVLLHFCAHCWPCAWLSCVLRVASERDRPLLQESSLLASRWHLAAVLAPPHQSDILVIFRWLVPGTE